MNRSPGSDVRWRALHPWLRSLQLRTASGSNVPVADSCCKRVKTKFPLVARNAPTAHRRLGTVAAGAPLALCTSGGGLPRHPRERKRRGYRSHFGEPPPASGPKAGRRAWWRALHPSGFALCGLGTASGCNLSGRVAGVKSRAATILQFPAKCVSSRGARGVRALPCAWPRALPCDAARAPCGPRPGPRGR
jgi:hypothetical protein